MTDTVEQAIYALRYQTGDSEKNLRAVRQEASALVKDTDKLSTSEENLNRSTLKFLGTLDRKHAAQLKQANQLERIQKLYSDGVISVDRYARAVNQITAGSTQVSGGMELITKSAMVLRNVLGTVGIAFSALGAVNFLRNTLDWAGAIDDISQTIGVTTDELQAYRAAAVGAGAASSLADDIIRRYTRTVGEALEGNKKAADAFRDLGLSAADLAGGPTASLPKVVSAMAEIESVTKRAQLEVVLFGRSGQVAEQILKAWADPADQIIAKYKELGLVIDEAMIHRIDRANASIEQFWNTMKVGLVEFLDVSRKAEPEFSRSLSRTLPYPFATEQTTAMGLANSLPFAGPDTQRFGAAGAKWADEEKAAIEAADRALKEHEKDVARFELDYRQSMARVAKELSDKFLKDIRASQQWVSQMYLAGRQVRDDVARNAQERADIERKTLEDSFDAYYKLQDELIFEEQDAADRRSKTVQRYWSDMINSMALDGRDFFRRFFETGEADFRDFTKIFRRGWAEMMADLVQINLLQPLMQSFVGGASRIAGGLFGRTATSSIGQGATSAVANNIGSSVAGSITAGGAMGGLAGAALGVLGAFAPSLFEQSSKFWNVNQLSATLLGPTGAGLSKYGVGPLGLAGLFMGDLLSKHPSNYTAYATFNPDMTSWTPGGDKPRDYTTGLAQQAGDAILAQVRALKELGIEFNQTLSNIWIGQRDPSTFQLAGGQRVSVGTVGDVDSLVMATVKALLQGAGGGSEALRTVLGRDYASFDQMNEAIRFVKEVFDVIVAGRPAMTQTEQSMKALVESFKAATRQAGELGLNVQQLTQGFARSFDEDVRLALLEIQSPMEYAIELWKRDAQARLDAAVALGANIEQVRQLNDALYRQIVQQSSPAVSGLQSFVQSYRFGPQSMATPAQQVASAKSAYDAALRSALADPTAQNAAAFQQAAQAYLPLAKSHYGVSTTYAGIEQGAISAAEQIIAKLQAPPAPSFAPVVSAVSAGAAMTTDAVKEVADKVDDLAGQVSTLNGVIAAVVRQMAGTAA